MLKRFPITALLETLQYAVFVYHQLGIHNLWIDCLRTIQDSGDDKAREISRMNQLFSNAYCTLSATNTPNAHHGFLDHRFHDCEMRILPCFLPSGLVGKWASVTGIGIRNVTSLWILVMDSQGESTFSAISRFYDDDDDDTFRQTMSEWVPWGSSWIWSQNRAKPCWQAYSLTHAE